MLLNVWFRQSLQIWFLIFFLCRLNNVFWQTLSKRSLSHCCFIASKSSAAVAHFQSWPLQLGLQRKRNLRRVVVSEWKVWWLPTQLLSQRSYLTPSWVTGILHLALCYAVYPPSPNMYLESLCQQSQGEETVSWGEWEVIPNYSCVIPAFYFKPFCSYAWFTPCAMWLSTWLVNFCGEEEMPSLGK